MKIFKMGEQTFAIIDGELWFKVDATEADPEPEQSQPVRPAVLKVKHFKGTHKRGRKPQKYNKGNPMPEDVKEEIRLKYAEGQSQADLAAGYEVCKNTIWKVLRTKEGRALIRSKKVYSYVCANSHQFKSKLQPGEVMCPTCHTRDCDLGTLNGPVEEEDI